MKHRVLDEIVSEVRRRLLARQHEISISELENSPFFEAPPLSLSKALRKEQLSVIAEIKRASPSQGVIRDPFDPVEIARSYRDVHADAISVLTEQDFFLGSLDHLKTVRSEVEVPILRKDFIVDSYQIVEARSAGADAVLLIVAILEKTQLDELVATARDLGMECLVELYEENELDRIDMDELSIIGVNNRNLQTFEIDLTHAGRVLGRVPEHMVRVAESGLRTAEDLATVRRSGIDAVLIGETFMRHENPGHCLDQIRRNCTLILEQYDV